MNSLALRREMRRRARNAHIAELERDTGFTPSVDAHGLPRVVVVRNPKGEWLDGNRWKSRGFDMRYGIDEVEAATKRACIRRARQRLRAMVERDLTGEIEVTV